MTTWAKSLPIFWGICATYRDGNFVMRLEVCGATANLTHLIPFNYRMGKVTIAFHPYLDPLE